MHILSTQRLSLRTLQPEDAAFYLDITNQPSWLANIGDKGLRTLDQARADIIAKPMQMQADKGFSLYAVCLRESDVVIGMCGLIKRDSLPEVDIGYALLPQYWGQGYAWEAASAVRDYGRDVIGLKCLMGICAAHNQASVHLLQKLGMQLIDDTADHGGGRSLTFSMSL